MKALVCDRFGALDDVRFRDVPKPSPGPGEILVRVRAAAGVVTGAAGGTGSAAVDAIDYTTTDLREAAPDRRPQGTG